MAEHSASNVTPQWRDDAPLPQTSYLPRRKSRAPQIFLALCFLLALLGTLGGVLSWMGSAPDPYFLPLFLSEYQARDLPAVLMGEADRQGLHRADLFSRWSNETRLEGHFIQQELLNLKSLNANDSAVVYVSAHALLDADGAVMMLPGDAAADNPRTWISLREVLAKLKDCPARHRLLVLDLMKPLGDATLGAIYSDIALAVQLEIEKHADPRLLVLTACAPGQTSLVSEEMGRSVFSFYFEEGLRGYAEAYSVEGRRNGQITVRELVTFLRGRVDRWAQMNRGHRQTPVLHGHGDFAITALNHNQPKEHVALPPSPKYPEPLLAAWKQRDQRWKTGSFLVQPRIFQKEQAILQEMEREWRGSHAQEKVSQVRLTSYQQQEKERATQLALLSPRSVSLAQEMRLGKKIDPATQAAVDALMTQTSKLAGKPEEVAKERGKLLEEFRAKTRDKSDFDLEGAVLDYAVRESAGDPATLRFLDELLRKPGRQGPRYAETLALRQLVDLIDRVPLKDWSAPKAVEMLRFTAQAEMVEADGLAVAWFGPLLDQAVETRHAAVVRFLTPGFSSAEELARTLRQAVDQYVFLADVGTKLHAAQETWSQASSLLPFGSAYLREAPDQEKNWTNMAQLARGLGQVMRSFPGEPPPSVEEWKVRLGERVAELQRVQHRLQMSLREIAHPFEAAHVQRVIQVSRLPSAGPAQLHTLDTLLASPLPLLDAETRLAVWQARRELAEKLLTATLRLDHEEDAARQMTSEPEAFDAEQASRARGEQALRQVEWNLALAQAGGLDPERLKPLRQAWQQAKLKMTDVPHWGKVSALTRHLWQRGLLAQFQEEKNIGKRFALAWIAPPLVSLAALDEGEIRIATQLQLAELRTAWTRLSELYRYRARDFAGLGLDSPGLRESWTFYLQAAGANEDLARPGPEAYVTLKPARPVDQLGPARAFADATLEIKRFLPPGAFGAVEVQVHLPDDVYFQVAPNATSLASAKKAAEPRTLSSGMPVRISLKEGALTSPTPRPAGVLASARFEGRTYHAVIAVPLPGATQDVQILISANPREPVPALPEIRLRPGKGTQSYFVYLRNPLDVERKVNLDWLVSDIPFPGAKLALTLAPRATQKVAFPEAAPPKAKVVPAIDPGSPMAPAEPVVVTESLPELMGPLQLRVTDAVTNRVLETKTIAVEVASPREYVQVREIQFLPVGPLQPKNKLLVQMQTSANVDGSPIMVRLVLSRERIPGLKELGGGTLHVELPPKTGSPPMALFAEEMKFAEGFPEEGHVYIDVDQVPRVFSFQTTFARRGDPTTPRLDSRPGVRIPTPPFAASTPTFSFPVEVDNAPTGSSLEVTLNRIEGARLEPDQTRKFSTPRHRRIGFWPSGPGGSIQFDGSVQDHQVFMDTTLIQGKRILRARLLDQRGIEIAEASQAIVIDSTPPTAVRFLDPPPRAKKGTPLKLVAQGFDAESGIEQAVFFLGKPQEDRMPKDAVPVLGSPTDESRNTWVVNLPLPEDRKGLMPVSVVITNRVGKSKAAMIDVQLLDTDPAKTGPTKIAGKVTEAGRIQPGLEVLLLDEKGKEKARTKTKADGTYLFDNLMPGKYQVYSVKPDSLRRALIRVEVGPNETKTVDLALAL